jgi:surfeit locus 1 family protein
MQTKSLVGLTALMLAAFAVLIGLGVWQLKRLHWKEGLIAEIETRTKGEPIGLDQAIAIAREGRDPSYYRVKVEGRFDHAKELYLYAVSEGRAGWHVITPFRTEDGEVVLIDRGFVPDELRNPASRAKGDLSGTVAVTGIVRVPETQGTFTPDNEVGANRWFWHDLQAMARSIGAAEVAPFYLEAEKSDVPGGWPEGGQTRLELPNNHLQYAITWFLLAACLLIVYGLYVRSLYRPSRPLE